MAFSTSWHEIAGQKNLSRKVMTKSSQDGETDIIQKYFAPLAKETPGAFGLKDDAGLIAHRKGMELVLTTDMIVEGIHFLKNASPRDIACKSLGVNISDLCAKGADPSVYLLSIALPDNPDPNWLKGLSEGFAGAQSDFGCSLLGGDTVHTPGPLALSITAVGYVPEGQMAHRSGAREGDSVYVTGTIGDAALGLALLQGANVDHLSTEQVDYLTRRYWLPQPRLGAIPVIRSHSNSAMDISDGLVGDFAKLCAASNVGGILHAADVPLSDAANQWLSQEPDRLSDILTGGDDYELLISVSQENIIKFESDCASSGLQISIIGCISSRTEDVKVQGADGKALRFDHLSYNHF
jgi:thiamine-monophosphate kinase